MGRGGRQQNLVSCPYCGTQTFERMLQWHMSKCASVPTGTTSEVQTEPAAQETSTPVVVPEVNNVPAVEIETRDSAAGSQSVHEVKDANASTNVQDVSEPSLDDLETQLLKSLEAVRQKKNERDAEQQTREEERAWKESVKREAERKAKEASKPIKIEIVQTLGTSILIRNDFRDDLLEVLKSTPGRSYRGVGENLIPFAEWPTFKARVSALPNVKVLANKEVEKYIEWFTTAPPFEVGVEAKYVTVVQGPGTSAHMLYQIPGNQWDVHKKRFLIPLGEAWRLAETFKNVEGVVYSDDVQVLVESQLKARAQIDIIAKSKDSTRVRDALTYRVTIDEETRTFGEWLMPFQRVGVEFLDALGACESV